MSPVLVLAMAVAATMAVLALAASMAVHYRRQARYGMSHDLTGADKTSLTRRRQAYFEAFGRQAS